MKKIVIHYPFIATYRIPIFTLLSQSDKYEFEYWAGAKGDNPFLLTSTENLDVKDTPLKSIALFGRRKVLEWQPKAIKYMLTEKMDAYIVLGNPNSLSTWLCVILAKVRNIPVLMWSHGYLKDEQGLKGYIRKFFYQLADMHLLYGNKAKNIMVEKGFSKEFLNVIYNSLDYDKQKYFREKCTYEDRMRVRKQYGFDEQSIVLIAIGRLETKLKLHQVLEAIANAKKSVHEINFIIVGDGSQKENLLSLVKQLNIQQNVVFYGACHEEEEISQLYNAADYSVVMGKVGLAAMHSLAYGTPMITNDSFDKHFPEIEAIIEGKTGFYFKEDDLEDFESKLKPIPYKGELYKNCISEIERNYTPLRQKILIESALDSLLGEQL